MDELEQQSTAEQIWLVKSSGVILGPYSKQQLVELLLKKEISIIDEIRSPSTRWGFLREKEEFRDVIKQLREQLSAQREETNTQYISQKSITQTEKTIIDELTPTPQPMAVNKAVTTSEQAPAANANIVFGHKHEHQSATAKRRPLYSRSSVLVALLAVVIVMLGLVFSQGLFFSRKDNKVIGGEDYLRLARTYSSYGNYSRSLEFYKKADLTKSLDPNSRLEMIPLMIVVENQYLAARHMLDDLKPQFFQDKKNTDMISALYALSYLKEGQFSEAEKRFQDLLVSAEADLKNKIELNLIEIKILKGQYDQALTAIEKINDKKNSVLILFKAMAVYRIYSEQNSYANILGPQTVKNMISELELWQKTTQDYLPESSLILSAYFQKLGNKDLLNNELQKLFLTYPDLTKEHVHDLLIDREIVSWAFLQNVCDLLMSSLGDGVQASSLNAYCAYQRGDLKSAIETVDRARTQFVNDPALAGLYAYFLYRSGHADEAKALQALSQNINNYLLTTTVAMVCVDRKDWQCATEKYSSLAISSAADSVQIMTGLAQSLYESGKRADSAKWLQKASQKSQTYGPLIELKEKLNE